jgi:hypothetical protein
MWMMTPLPLADLHLSQYLLCLPLPNNSSHSEPAQVHARTNFHLSLRGRQRSMAPSMVPAACAVKRQVACDTQSRSNTVSPNSRRRPSSLSAMRHLRRSPSLLRIYSRRHHCHCYLKDRQLNHRRRRHNSNSNVRNTAGHHPSPDLVPFPHHHCLPYLPTPPRSSHHSLPSILQAHQRLHSLKRTKKGLTLQQVLPVRVLPERTGTTEASPSTRWVSAKSLVPQPHPRPRTPPKLPVLHRKARRQTRCIQPSQNYRGRLPAAHRRYRLRRRPLPVLLSRLLLHRRHCSVRTMERRAVAAR